MFFGGYGGITGISVWIIAADSQGHDPMCQITHGNEQPRCPCEAPPAPSLLFSDIEPWHLSAHLGAETIDQVAGELGPSLGGQAPVSSAGDFVIREAALAQMLAVARGE